MYEYEAIVSNVVDGDTIDATLSLGFYLIAKLRLRLLGVNCPEMHAHDPAPGRAAKEYTTARLLGKAVVLATHKSDDFGRWLARVTIDGVDFNRELIDRGYAVPYMV